MIRMRISAGREVKGKTCCCWGGGAAMTVFGGSRGGEKDEGLTDGWILWFVRRRWLGMVEDVSNW